MSFSVISSFCQFVTAKIGLAGEEARDSDQPIRELTLSAAFSAAIALFFSCLIKVRNLPMEGSRHELYEVQGS